MEHKTTIENDQVAVVYDDEQGFQILLPDPDILEELPEGAAALVAVAVRLGEDPLFLQDQITWFNSRSADGSS